MYISTPRMESPKRIINGVLTKIKNHIKKNITGAKKKLLKGRMESNKKSNCMYALSTVSIPCNLDSKYFGELVLNQVIFE